MARIETIRLPRRLPPVIEVEHDCFTGSHKATVAQWRAAQALARAVANPECLKVNRKQILLSDQHTIARLVRIAETLGLPDDVPLWPRLCALSNDNVASLPRRAK